MKSSNKVNININKDDENLNDYLYTWSEFGKRPNKTSIHGFIDSEIFLSFIEKIEHKEISKFTDVIPNENIPIINQKVFISLQDDLFLTYTHLDKIHEESFISDVSIFYTNVSTEIAQSIANQISELQIQAEEENELTSSKLHILNIGQNGFELEILLNGEEYEDIEYYYEDNVLKKIKKNIKVINRENKGLTILCGERGCGKTTLLRYLSSKINKNVIFIPCNLIENSINNFEFRRFLKQNSNSVLILDDVELYFSQIYAKSTFFTNNLLQLVDGFYANDLNINIILSLNCKVNEVDENLLDSNCLIDIIEVDKLSEKKVTELCDFLDKKNKLVGDLKLIDVIRKPVNKFTDIELGFK